LTKFKNKAKKNSKVMLDVKFNNIDCATYISKKW